MLLFCITTLLTITKTLMLSGNSWLCHISSRRSLILLSVNSMLKRTILEIWNRRKLPSSQRWYYIPKMTNQDLSTMVCMTLKRYLNGFIKRNKRLFYPPKRIQSVSTPLGTSVICLLFLSSILNLPTRKITLRRKWKWINSEEINLTGKKIFD